MLPHANLIPAARTAHRRNELNSSRLMKSNSLNNLDRTESVLRTSPSVRSLFEVLSNTSFEENYEQGPQKHYHVSFVERLEENGAYEKNQVR